MRLWSIHPRYLDKAGLTALWREGLLAQKVLQGETRGYRNHPQLVRFRSASDAVAAIGYYLDGVWEEADRRGYQYNRNKIICSRYVGKIPITSGQLGYEYNWLLNKLKMRAPELFEQLKGLVSPEPHPLFTVIRGEVAPWERVIK